MTAVDLVQHDVGVRHYHNFCANDLTCLLVSVTFDFLSAGQLEQAFDNTTVHSAMSVLTRC